MQEKRLWKDDSRYPSRIQKKSKDKNGLELGSFIKRGGTKLENGLKEKTK